ncbi:A/G-specific adenine glycosylase [Neisseriaceae bacterium ESL0693]|nr:A/G-specific adenine glycosylase [Neisseriaceae bacterium ESL0693]
MWHDNKAFMFADKLIAWQRIYGRHGLPWQTRDPYRVWLSEIMLQQTQVSTVLDYYPRFIAVFPDVASLAMADEDQVLSLWQGLGYYSRARNLHKAARQVMTEFGGQFPQTRQQLQSLCGVGRSTAAAIAAFCFHARETILDGNVKRVLCRVYAQDGEPGSAVFEAVLWQLAQSLVPERSSDMPAYIQGLMDLGAMVCKRTKPLCDQCPMQSICLARQQQRIDVLPRKKKPPLVTVLPLFWLVLRNRQGAVWLQKRAAKGIWGGLWCVPCFESMAELQDEATLWQLTEADLKQMPKISHRLTHRQLQITPLVALPVNEGISAHRNNGQWVLAQDLADYGLPKPLMRYLAAS